MPVLDRSEWPPDLLRPEAACVAGVFVGGCVARGDGSGFRRQAHAHHPDGRFAGWICIRSPRRIGERSLILHELAHVVSGEGHSDAFRRALVALGGTLEPQWENGTIVAYDAKRPRGLSTSCRSGYHGLCHGIRSAWDPPPGVRCRCDCGCVKSQLGRAARVAR